MNSISWVKVMGILLLVLTQTLRVLLTTYLPHPTSSAPTLQFIVSQDASKNSPNHPGTALQPKIEANVEKSLGNSLNIHLQEQMGSFKASMLESFQSLQDKLSTEKLRWIRFRLQLLSLKPLLLLQTYPVRDPLRLPQMFSKWK